MQIHNWKDIKDPTCLLVTISYLFWQVHPGYFSLFQKTHHLKMCVKKETSVRTGPPQQLFPLLNMVTGPAVSLGSLLGMPNPGSHFRSNVSESWWQEDHRWCAGEGLRSRGAALQALRLQCLFSWRGSLKKDMLLAVQWVEKVEISLNWIVGATLRQPF